MIAATGRTRTEPDLARPRSVRVHNAILDATTDLLVEGGLAATTTEAISRGSGASKATIYNHWPNRLVLAIDAFAERMGGDVVAPDTGKTRDDLLEHVRLVCEYYAGPWGRIYAQLLAASVTDELAAEHLRSRFLDGRRDVVFTLFRRGVERGDIADTLDLQAVNDVLFGPIIFRLVSGHAPLDPDAAAALGAIALDGILA